MGQENMGEEHIDTSKALFAIGLRKLVPERFMCIGMSYKDFIYFAHFDGNLNKFTEAAIGENQSIMIVAPSEDELEEINSEVITFEDLDIKEIYGPALYEGDYIIVRCYEVGRCSKLYIGRVVCDALPSHKVTMERAPHVPTITTQFRKRHCLALSQINLKAA